VDKVRPNKEAAHLNVEFPAILAFLFNLLLDATNWRGEQAMRAAEAAAKIAGDRNQNSRGAVTQLATALLLPTAHQRHLDGGAIVVYLLSTPIPTVPAAIGSAPS